MSQPEFLDISSAGSRRVRGLFPVPFVGLAILLITLILLTPVLFANGPPAPGSLLAQAELIIDRVPSSAMTDFYVRAVGTTVRYDSITLGLATNFAWSGGYPSGPLNWSTWHNGTGVLEVSLASGSGTLALNVTAVYTAGGGTADYAALIALNVSGPATSQSIALAVSSSTPGVSAPATISTDNLPLTLFLQDFGSGGAP